MGILSRVKVLAESRVLGRGPERGELVSVPLVGEELHEEVGSGRSEYLVIALRLVRRWEKDRGCLKELLDALLLLEEVYGPKRVLASVKRPFALLAAVTRGSSLTSLAAESGFPTVGAFVGAEVEEELRRSCPEKEIVFRHLKGRESVIDSAVAGEYPTYGDWKEASLLAEGLERMDLLPLLAALVLRLRKEDPGALRALVEMTGSYSRGLEHGSPPQLGSRSLLRLLEQTIAGLDEQDPSPLWRILRRALSGGYRDG
ncbi:MAG TPA: hypothetical protein DCP08_06515 [Chloroflexi bacterium]|nr:hypothetical protein [Chloroflexota bacterium]